jgi:arylsulfatase A-like enzyme
MARVFSATLRPEMRWKPHHGSLRRALPGGALALGLGLALGGASLWRRAGGEPAATPSVPPPTSAPDRDSTVGSGPSTEAPGSGDADGAAGPAGGRPDADEVVLLDLSAHPERLERRGPADARAVDFGTGDGAGLHLGGWQTGAGAQAAVLPGGRTVSVVPGVVARLFLPPGLATEGGLALALTAAAPGARSRGNATLYLDDRTVGYVHLPADGAFGTVRTTLPGDRLAGAGPHVLSIRVPRTGEVPGIGRAGLLLDRLVLAPLPGVPEAEGDGDRRSPGGQGSAGPSEAAAPPHDVGPQLPLRDGDAIRLAPGSGVRVTLSLPPGGGRLQGRLAGPGARALRVTVGLEPVGGDPPTRGRVDLPPSRPGPFDRRLPGRADRLTLVDLALPEDAPGPVRVVRPKVLVRTQEASVAAPPPRTWRHLVVVLCDTLRADALRLYAPESRVRTPALDRLGRAAATVVGARAPENWTKPSVASLLSGLMPWEHGAQDGDSVVPASAKLLSERLEGAGFHTGAFIANGYVSGKFGFERGWTTWRNYIREGRRTPARFVARDVLEWLDARPEGERFFLYVHTIDPHVPYIVPDEDLAAYDARPYAGPVDFQRDRLLLEKVKTGRVRLSDRDRERLRALYDAEISYHDHHLATVLEALDRRGLREDTVVVFTSDHGEEFFEHGSVGHGHSVFEELLRVPLVIRLPGLTDRGLRLDDGAVGLADVAPTVLDALGLPIPGELSGRSLLPRLRGERPTAPPYTVSAFMRGWRAVVEGHLKLVQRTTRETRLYDLRADPGETRDLAAERPLAVAHLRRLLGQGLGSERVHAPATTAIDPATAAQLRALGYTDDFRRPGSP